MALDLPIFVDTDPNAIVQELIAFYETATGKTLQDAQPERLLINSWAYREALVRNAIQEAGLMNLVAFSKAPILDYLADLVGVKRLPEQPSTVDIEFTLVTGHSALVIPLGMRIGSDDGKAVFFVSVSTPVAVGVNTITISCICDTAGTIGNGYIAGNIKNILDPLAGVQSAANTTTSANGSDAETDDQMRVRITLAPEAFSNAGSYGAYKFFAFSADPQIIDVKITSPTPGEVDIYSLTALSGGTPSPILAKVFASCNAENVRPLTDTVLSLSPTAVNYTINVDITLFDTADQTLANSQIISLLTKFKDDKRKQLGRDIMKAQIVALATIKDVVYDVVVNQPATDLVINDTQYSECTGITVNIIGTNQG